MPLYQRFFSDRRGANAVEFALIAPVLLVVISGIINYGLYFTTSHALQQMANNAARSALAGLTHEERLTLVRDTIATEVGSYGFIASEQAQVELTEVGHALTVVLTYAHTDQGLPFISTPSRIERRATIARGGY